MSKDWRDEAECIDDALATNQDIGVRGGLSPNERRALKRRRANEQRRAQ